MGYILPITHHQYNDYRNRMEPVKPDRFYIDPLVRLDLQEYLRDKEPREEDRKEYQHFSEQISHHKPKPEAAENRIFTPNSSHAGKSHKIYADLTGIGRHFNESV